MGTDDAKKRGGRFSFLIQPRAEAELPVRAAAAAYPRGVPVPRAKALALGALILFLIRESKGQVYARQLLPLVGALTHLLVLFAGCVAAAPCKPLCHSPLPSASSYPVPHLQHGAGSRLPTL